MEKEKHDFLTYFLNKKVCIHMKTGGVVGSTKFIIAIIDSIDYDGILITIHDRTRDRIYKGWINFDNVIAVTEYIDKEEDIRYEKN